MPATCEHYECKLHSGTLRYFSFCVHAWYTNSSCLQFLPKCRSWIKDTRSTTQFNLHPSNCRHHFNFVSVVWLTDQHGKLLYLCGEEFTIRFHLCECLLHVCTQYKVNVSENQVDTLKGAVVSEVIISCYYITANQPTGQGTR